MATFDTTVKVLDRRALSSASVFVVSILRSVFPYSSKMLSRRTLTKSPETFVQIVLDPIIITEIAVILLRRDLQKTMSSFMIHPPAVFEHIGRVVSLIGLPKLHPSDTGRLIVFSDTLLIDFSGSPRFGSAPLRVKFTNLSQSPVNYWYWDFGDNQNSTEAEPIHTYRREGVYSVTLRAGADIFGYKSLTKERYIIVSTQQGDMEFTYDNALGYADISIDGRDVTRDAGLETATLIALFTDARASESDLIPDGTEDRRGWWADNTLGSKLWLLSRAKMTDDVISLAKQYAEDALQIMMDDGVADRVVVETSRYNIDTIALGIEIISPEGDEYFYRYYYNWRNQVFTRG